MAGAGRGRQTEAGWRYLGHGVDGVADVDEGVGLVGAGGDEVRVAVSERVDGDAGGQVEVLAAVDVVELAPAAGHDDDLGPVVRAY